ncbi:unnamed protein product (macronuclear) [Paramecium tetraurelia]|uniref:Histone deacetylase interacting domain-containing protein n=1 Tax=Paramecium tetraurelia TaxID=5888 RepID=A0EDC2_PARTE|nr:uncharacterized protein GSPATT00004158001 [Paramecium tetraurelia]CAK93289.1 unnamed protein product [Paramecium tetraurelia]|eukprot:XP_001460686.1 hypothetical protein (macronuclear) [Paramecium tetraurelia strain d4-2]
MSEDILSKSNMGEFGEDIDQQLYEKCEQFCQKLRRTNQQLYKQFSNIVNQNSKAAKEQLGQMLSEEPEILKEVNTLLEEDVKFKTQKEKLTEFITNESNKPKALETILKQIQNGHLDGHQNKDHILDLFSNEPQLQQQFLQSFKKKHDQIQPKKKVEENRNYFQKLLDKNGVVDMNELLFWDKFRMRVIQQFPNDFQQFMNEFMKIIHLYSECIITQMEVMELINQQEWLETEYIDEIRSMLSTRVIARRIQTPLFKPLKDTDFAQVDRVTRSYVRMPIGYAKANNNQEILNHSWVSVPFGSEDQSFLIMRKNTFEEQLFKSEDERFEFDVNIQQIKRTINLLQEIIDGNKEDPILIAKVIDMRILQQLYRNQTQDQNEVLQIFQSKPTESAKILIKRVKQKLNELIQARNNKAKQVWENVSLNNFHRSLDHRSFYFKKNDKLVINGQRFAREIEEYAKNVLIKHLGSKEHVFIKRKQDQIQYTFENSFLNSLAQMTNIRPTLPKQMPLISSTKDNIRFSPLISLWMGNEQILQECGQFVIHYLQIMGGNNSLDKRNGTILMIKLINHFFQVPMKPMQISQLTLIDTKLKNEIQELEIYDIHYNPEDASISIPAIENESPGLFLNLQPKVKLTTYVTQNLYILLRFLHTIYQRLEMAYVISQQNKLGQDKRYNLFKSALFLSLKAKDFKYEDHLRSLFGKHGFIFSTLEKVFHDAAKQLAVCASDVVTMSYFEKSVSVEGDLDKYFQVVSSIVNGEGIKVSDLEASVFCKFQELPEEEQLLKLHQAFSRHKPEKKPIYRIACWHKACFISILPAYGGCNQDICKSCKQPFLMRNMKRGERRMMIINSIEWIVDEFSHFKPIINQGEDYLKCV